MKCDRCGKPAQVYVTQIVGSEVKKVALCNECAEMGGILDPAAIGLVDMALKGEETTPEAAMKCPNCGFSLAQFRQVHRFGCAECYHVFRSELEPMLGEMHRGTRHHGKVPTRQLEEQQQRHRLAQLEAELQLAVEGENFERAAELRDQIRELEAAGTSAVK